METDGINMNLEVWKDVVGYEGLYLISNIGNIRKISGKNKDLKPSKTPAGYFNVTLYKNKTERKYFIHRLVATAFLEKADENLFVNHIDSNRANNNINNLEWVTAKQNDEHSFLFGKRKNSIKKVVKMTPEGKFIRIYNCAREAAKDSNLSKSVITNYINGHRQGGGGFSWKYLNASYKPLKTVLCKNDKETLIFKSVRKAAKFFGVHHTNVLRYFKNPNKEYHGYFWRYDEEKTE